MYLAKVVILTFALDQESFKSKDFMNGLHYFRGCILALRCESNGLVEIKFENRFRWNHHLLALREYLGSRTSSGTDSSSDGCALSVSKNRANDRAGYCPASDHLSRALVRAKSPS